MAFDGTSHTELAPTKMDLISQIVQRQLIERSKLAATVTDLSAQAGKGVKSIALPKGSDFSTGDITENTEVAAQVLTMTSDVMQLDQRKAIRVLLEDAADMQSMVDVETQIAERMGREMALDMDRQIYAELKLASAAGPDHRILYANNLTDNTLGKADILEARKLLKVQNAPEDSDWYLAISPSSEQAILSIDDFVHADKYGSSQGLVNGEIGRLYGFRVIVSNVVEDNATVAYHREAVAFATQRAIRFEQDRDLEKVANEYLATMFYGVKVLQDGKLNVLLGTGA